jgi:FtsH-binding integral membrane protein
MADLQQTKDNINWEVDKDKLPETLNVLTILTFVGCGLQLLFSFVGYARAQASLDTIVAAENNENTPSFAKKLMGPHALEIAQNSLENRLPILILTLVSCALCIYGAIQMRARKKQGFYIYLIGELVLPIITSAIFLGVAAMTGMGAIFGFAIVAVFLILYAAQLKHLS